MLMKASRLAAASILLAAVPAKSETIEDRQLWSNVNVSGTTSSGFAYFVEVQPRFFGNAGRLGQVDARAAIGWRLSPAVVAYAGYAHIFLPLANRPDRNEERIFTQLSWTVGRLVGGTLASRTRLEHRRRSNGNDTGWRFRQMLRYVHPLTSPEKTRALVSFEGMAALNDTDWGAHAGLDQLRGFASVEVPIDGRSTLELGYLNQAINDPGRRIRMNHVASVALFLRR